MFYRTIILTLLVLFVVFSMDLMAQTSGQVGTTTSQESRAGNVIGGGLAFHWFYTEWYVYYAPNYVSSSYYPSHDISRVAIYVFYKRRSIFTFGPVHIDGQADIHLGISGGTKEDWATDAGGEMISEGGGTFAIDGIIKFAYPTQLSPTLPIAPYAGLGVQYAIIGSNGEGVSGNLDNYRGRYDDGWTEYFGGLMMGLGVDVDFPKFVVNAEYRFMLTGGVSADWDPVGSEPEDDGSSFGAFLIGFGYKF